MLPYYEVHDRGRGPHLLMVHGFLSSRAQWRPNLDALSEHARPVVVELYGHGRSPTPSDPAAYQVGAYLEAFEMIRGRLGVERWILCGQSFGAGLVFRYALAHPARVLGIIFTNSMSALTPPSDAARQAEQARRAAAIASRGRAAIDALPFHPRHAKRVAALLREELIADAELISPDGIAQSIAVTSPELSIADELHRIAAPTLLVNGRFEERFQPLRDQALRALPHLRIADIDGGHAVNLTAADTFNHVVIEFIRDIIG